jgi:2-methylcitrate dehydratase PrpD
MLARAGMTGPETSLDGRHGLFRQFTGDEAAGRALPLADRRPRSRMAPAESGVQVLSLLPLPASVHRGGREARRARRARGDVERILCRVPQGEAAVICEPWETKQAPANGHAARWSLPIAVAAQLVEGKVDLATFETPASDTGGAAWRDGFRGNRCRTRASRSASRPNSSARRNAPARRTVRIDDVFGNHTRPPRGTDAVLAKFRSNAARSLKADAVGALERAAQQLPYRTRPRDAVPGLYAVSSCRGTWRAWPRRPARS